MQDARKAVIFDLYGTLVDLDVDEDAPVFWDALANDTLPPEKHISGGGLKDLFMHGIQKVSTHSGEGFMLEAAFSGMLEELGVIPTLDNVSLFAEKFREYSIIHLGKKNYTDDLLHTIRAAGYKVGLVSNTEALLTAYDLKILGLEEQFEAIVLSSNVGVKKPDKRIFEIVLDRLNVEPGDCVFMGDNYDDDIEGALRVGMHPVFLTALKSFKPEEQGENRGGITCAGFDLQEIIEALRTLGFVLPSLRS